MLPARVRDYVPAQLDELCASGEVVWAGAGSLPGNDGWVRLVPAEAAALLLPAPLDTLSLGPAHEAILAALDGGQALFFRALADAAWGGSEHDDDADRWSPRSGIWSGPATSPTTPWRRCACCSPARRAAGASGRCRRRGGVRATPATADLPCPPGPGRRRQGAAGGGCPIASPAATRRLHAVAEALLDRHGVLTRGAVAAEQIPGGFSAVYPVLSAFEDAGRCRRGYFVEGLGAAQFAVPGAVDRMRALAAEAERADEEPAWTSPVPPSWEARDAARAGAASPRWCWPRPTRPTLRRGAAVAGSRRASGGHRPGRKAGALVVLVDGELVMYVERGGKSLLTWSDDPAGAGSGRAGPGDGDPGRGARQALGRAGRRRARLRRRRRGDGARRGGLSGDAEGVAAAGVTQRDRCSSGQA